MSKKKRKRQSRSPSQRRKQQSSSLSSLAIPIVVGLVVVAIIVGAIISIENQQPVAASGAGDGSVPMVTAGAQPTRPIPHPSVARISLEDTVDGLEQGQLVIVDVRSSDSYAKSHIKGSISIPEEEIEARADELPRDKDIVLYCT